MKQSEFTILHQPSCSSILSTSLKYKNPKIVLLCAQCTLRHSHKLVSLEQAKFEDTSSENGQQVF